VSSDEFVLAGHIATPEAWAQLSAGWEELLTAGTVAANGKYHFKMSEMALTPQRMERVPPFYWLIEKHVVTSVSYRINLGDFARAKERVFAMVKNFNWTIDFAMWENPYFFVSGCSWTSSMPNVKILKRDCRLMGVWTLFLTIEPKNRENSDFGGLG
jgi:hypothetical protein